MTNINILCAIIMLALIMATSCKHQEVEVVTLPRGSVAYLTTASAVKVVDPSAQKSMITVHGDVFFRISKGSVPMNVHTKLLHLTVTEPSAFRVMADSTLNGEQVDVLYGKVFAKKAYDSPFDEVEILHGGNMVMINITIDLMEKETLDTIPLRHWSDSLMRHSRVITQ